MLANWKERIFPLNRRQAVFAMLLCLVLAVNAVPALRASALYLITDGEETTAVGLAEPVTADKLIVVGSADGSAELRFEGGHKVTVTRGEDFVQYATTRANETAAALLKRMDVSVGPMEMVKVDVSEPDIAIEIASSFTYYETLTEPAAHATVYTENCRIPKGKTEVYQQGIDGTREVVYEVVYADGELVSRQAVAEQNNTSVTEYAYVGTLVEEVQAGDTIASVVKNSDGSGYLRMKSGDSLHFTGSMEVTCTAYTTGHDGVGTRTATGTSVARGCVAVDKSVIPLGTTMFITTASGSYTYGMSHAEDTGVRGAKIDLYMDTYDECIQFGRRSSIAYFLD